MSSDMLVIVPAYNAAATVSELIDRLTAHVAIEDILIVDDGSGDATGQNARNAGVAVLSHETNKGKGAALKTGFKYAVDRCYSAVLTIDADLQHDPDCLPSFRTLGGTNKYDVIIGTRKRTGDMPCLRVFANFASSAVISLFSGVRIRDSQSGYRWIATDLLRRLSLKGDRYDLESEILLAVGRMGGSIGEIGIPTIYRGSVSFISPTVDAVRALKILCRSLFW